MVEIQCPHCDEDIELDNGASGLFDCPHCDEEFSWGSNARDVEIYKRKEFWMGLGIPFLFTAVLMLVFAFGALLSVGGEETWGLLSLGSICLWPVVGFGVVIYASTIGNKPLAIGGSASAVVGLLVTITFILWVMSAIGAAWSHG